MNEKNKKTDKFTYIMILIMGIIGIAIISYFIIFGTLNLINRTQVSKMLIDMNIYQTYYDILNVVSAMMIPIFLTIIFMSVPYIINSIILGKIFIKKYKKYKGEKKNNIIKIIILAVITLITIINGIFLYPMTSRYEVKINSKISDISSAELREFLEDRMKTDIYVYKIKISRSIPNDYSAKIYYKEIVNKVQITYLAGEEAGFIDTDAKELTKTLGIRSIVIMILGDILYIYFLVYILKEFKRISE